MKRNVFLWLILVSFSVFSITACKENTGHVVTPDSNNNSSAWPAHFGIGKAASPEQIAAMDIDVRPDGKGLPQGSGTTGEGRKVYAAKCAVCHGTTGKEGPFGRLVTSDSSRSKTIGNYWPYATTIFDYIRRAMPFSSPGSLSDNEVYQVTAYLLYANNLIDSTMVIDARSLPQVGMPAKKLFVVDDRTGGKEIR